MAAVICGTWSCEANAVDSVLKALLDAGLEVSSTPVPADASPTRKTLRVFQITQRSRHAKDHVMIVFAPEIVGRAEVQLMTGMSASILALGAENWVATHVENALRCVGAQEITSLNLPYFASGQWKPESFGSQAIGLFRAAMVGLVYCSPVVMVYWLGDWCTRACIARFGLVGEGWQDLRVFGGLGFVVLAVVLISTTAEAVKKRRKVK